MDESVATTCRRCGAGFVVMSAAAYLSSTDAELEFTLHAEERESQVAIRSDDGTYACLMRGAPARLRHQTQQTREPARFARSAHLLGEDDWSCRGAVAVGRPVERRPLAVAALPAEPSCAATDTGGWPHPPCRCSGQSQPHNDHKNNLGRTGHDSTLAAGAASCRSTRSLVVFTPALRRWLARQVHARRDPRARLLLSTYGLPDHEHTAWEAPPRRGPNTDVV